MSRIGFWTSGETVQMQLGLIAGRDLVLEKTGAHMYRQVLSNFNRQKSRYGLGYL